MEWQVLRQSNRLATYTTHLVAQDTVTNFAHHL